MYFIFPRCSTEQSQHSFGAKKSWVEKFIKVASWQKILTTVDPKTKLFSARKNDIFSGLASLVRASAAAAA